MNRFLSFAILCLLAASTAASAADRDLLAHASVDRVWVAQVSKPGTADEKTDILFRQDGADKPWQKLATIPARATSLASRSSQLAVLLSDGRWESIWAATGASTGRGLPANGRILTLADDGQSLWAIGSVHGGFAAAQAAAAAEAANATTQPTPASTQASQPISRPDLPAKLVLFHQDRGRWLPLPEVPPDANASQGSEISLAIVGDQPMIAFKSATGSVHIYRLSADRNWDSVTEIPGPIAEFELLSAAKAPILWINPGKGPGALYPIGSASIALAWPDNTAPESLPAIAAVGTTLSIFGIHDRKLYEHRYDPDGKSLGAVAVVSVPVDVRDTSLGYWIDAALMTALAVSVLATLYRRGEQLRRPDGDILAPPPPAPQLRRLAAGLIDLLPVLVVLGYMSTTVDPERDLVPQLQSAQNLSLYGIGVCIYLLHTTLSEVFTGRTLGKFLLGLRTVTIEGGTPDTGQFLIRNLLRIIDLLWFPLTLVLISPLRQRSADVAAGTMVIRNTPQDSPPTDDKTT